MSEPKSLKELLERYPQELPEHLRQLDRDDYEMTRRLRALDERHRPVAVRWASRDVCGACVTSWPCETHRILEGEVRP